MRGARESFCTATLIRPNIALTASHCLHGVIPGNVVFGIMGDWPHETRVSATRFVVPVTQKGSLVNDIALVQLESDFYRNFLALKKTSNNLPAEEPQAQVMGLSSLRAEQGEEAIVIGFGINEKSEQTIERRKGTVKLHKYVKDAAGREFLSVVSLKDSGQIACSGDSGGPLLVRRDLVSTDVKIHDPNAETDEQYTIAGIVSFGQSKSESDELTEFCENTKVVVYVPMDPYTAVIRQLIKALD